MKSKPAASGGGDGSGSGSGSGSGAGSGGAASGGGGKSAALHYLNSPIHRIVRDGWMQGGDIIDGKGSSGASIYGAPFADETFTAIKHDAAGVLVRCSSPPLTPCPAHTVLMICVDGVMCV